MEANNFKQCFTMTQMIIDGQKKISEITGENFNIFQILKIGSDEVRTHSSFLAELLNPKGVHGKGNIFLQRFVETIGIKKLKTDFSIVEAEKYIGPIDKDYTQGGRVDICISDNEGNRILIENKIHAQDQRNQLLRYHNFDPEAEILYLTLYGDAPSKSSIGDLLENNDFKTISYQVDMLDWLDSCRKEAVELPNIREIISQYISLIKTLTKQAVANKMSESIRNFIAMHPEYLEAIQTCSSELQSIIQEAKNKFFQVVQNNLPKEEITCPDGIIISFEFGEDSDGFHFGYLAKRNGENISSSNDAQKYQEILNRINQNFRPGGPWLGWLNPSPFSRYQRFTNLPVKQIVELYSDAEMMNRFVKEILAQEQQIRNELRHAIHQMADKNSPKNV